MRHGFVQSIDNTDGNDRSEIFGIPVIFRRRNDFRQNLARLFTTTDFDAFSRKRIPHFRKECGGDLFVNQQRLQRVANFHTFRLRIDDNRHGHVDVRIRRHILMTNAVVMLQHRNPCVFGNRLDKAFAATRDNNIDITILFQQFIDNRMIR